MKMDKEFFNKHRFWCLLGAFALLWLIPLCVVAFGMSSADNEKKYNDQLGAVQKLGDFKNQSFNEALGEKEGVLDKQRQTIWAEEWKVQDGMFKWPAIEGLPANELMRKAYFGDSFSSDEKIDTPYRRKWGTAYKSQLADFVDLAKPAYFNNNSFAEVIRPVLWRDQEKPPIYPTMEEIWYSQEDLNVRREVLGVIHNAIDAAGRFANAAVFLKVDTFQDPLVAQRYQNGEWQLDLQFQPSSGQPASEDKKGEAAPDSPPAKAPAEGAGDAPPADEKKVYLSPTSLLKSIRTDDRPAPLTGLHLELRQRDPYKRGAYLGRVTIVLKRAEPLAYTESIDFKAAGLTKPIELKGFDLTKPIDIELLKDDSAPAPKDPNRSRRMHFHNIGWDLDLAFEMVGNQWMLRNTSKLTNIHPGRRLQSLYGVELQLRQADLTRNLFLQGEAIPWGKSIELKDVGVKENLPLRGFRLTDPIEVNQVTTWQDSDLSKQARGNEQARKLAQYQAELIFWQNSPVKRIDNIELGAAGLSDRVSLQHFPDAAKTLFVHKAIEESTKKPAPGASSAEGGEKAIDLSGSSSAANPFATPNYQMERRRYAAVSDPVRRVPVCVVLIVDQAHIQDVLAAFTPANSRIHFQTMQVIWQHVPGGVTPPSPPGQEPSTVAGGAPGAGGGSGLGDSRITYPAGGGYPKPPSGGGEATLGGGGGGGGLQRPGGGAGPGGFGPPNLLVPPGGKIGEQGPGAEVVEDNPNLVELQIYGLVSLYERYPKKNTEPKTEEKK